MVTSRQGKHLYEFGRFRVDEAERLLLRDGQPLSLRPKAFDVLLALVKKRGHLVEKDELIQQLWPDTFVEEANLSNNISLLRRLLGDDSREHLYIETVPRRGYRFVAEVIELPGETTELIIEERASATLTLEQESNDDLQQATIFLTRGRAKRLAAVVVAALAVIIGIASGAYYFLHKPEASSAPVRSIAVLPFKPLAADSRDESLEMGMADTLITRLSNIRQMAVRPMSAVRRYAGLEQDAMAAGREQAVDAVLDGSIQKSGEKIRVVVRLVRMTDGRQLWADQFDEKVTDIFAVQDSISERVAAALAVTLTGEERELLTKHNTENTEAYQLYLKGRLFYLQLTEESGQRALDCFSRAIAVDPNYALAYAGKADVYSANSSLFLAPAEAMPKAREAARKALSIDDQLAEAHFSMALVKLRADWDWAGAESEFKRALEIKPRDADMHLGYSAFLTEQKRFDEALVELRRSLELDPVSLGVSYRVGRLLYLARQYEQSLAQCQEAVALYPDFDGAHRVLGSVLRQKGIYEDAIAELRKAVDLHRADASVSELGNTYALAGRRDDAKRLVEELEGLARRRYVSPVSIARIYAGLGEKELVFGWLGKAYEDHSDHLLRLGVDPSFDSVRSDPRFQDLLRRVGLGG